MISCIAKIKLENLTYTFPGGFNAAPYSTCLGLWEVPRAQSFKGLWRWWLRALLSGALWNSGKYDVKRVQQATERLLGSTKQASKFIIHISAEGKAEPLSDQAIKKWKQESKQLKVAPNVLSNKLPRLPKISPIPPRLSLLLRARESYERLAEKISSYHPGDLKITIKLLKRPFIDISFKECSVAIASLLLSLIFGGIGAIVRRGFGSLLFTQVEISKEFQEYENTLSDIMKASEPGKIRSLLCQLIKKSLSDARELLSVESVVSFSEVPNHPLLSEPGDPPKDTRPFNLSVFILSVPSVTSEEKRAFQIFKFKEHETMKLLTLIGYSTTKLFWKLIDGKSFRTPGFAYNTWVMGLPRKQEFDKQKLQVPIFQVDLYEDDVLVGNVRWDSLKTGYSLNDEDRRISAISIRPIKRLGRFSWLIALYGFISKDWYDKLYHYGVTPPPKRRTMKYKVEKKKIALPINVNKAFINAWIKLKNIYGVKL